MICLESAGFRVDFSRMGSRGERCYLRDLLNYAVKEKYRFYSYGDCMLVL